MTAQVSYVDDETIAGTDELLIRLPPNHVVWDANLRRHRASSEALDDDELSVYFTKVLREHGLTAKDVLEGHADSWSVAGLAAAVFRDKKLPIVRDPSNTGRRYDPAHGLVIGPKPRTMRSKMAKKTYLAVAGELPPSA